MLQQAIELYRGDFLDGFYDDWVLSERYRLESLYCDALGQLMAAREAAGEHAAALAAAQRLLEQDPLREDAHRAAMRAYCRLGQRHAALAQYGRCQQVLQAELGIEPMAETQALRQAIVEGRLACETGPAVAVMPAATPRRETARHPLDAAGQIPLVGREEELAFLADGWQAALAGPCRLLLVSGEAGVGKTRLAQEFADQQRWQGVRALQGRCYEFERLLPYQPMAEALRSLPTSVALAVSAALPAWITAQVSRLAPDLFAQETSPPTPLPSTSSGQALRGEGRAPPPSLPGKGGGGLGVTSPLAPLPSTSSGQALRGEGLTPPPSLQGKGAGGLGQGEEQERLFEGAAGSSPDHPGPAAGAGRPGPTAVTLPPVRSRGGVAARPALR
jgi:hypothetical protein